MEAVLLYHVQSVVASQQPLFGHGQIEVAPSVLGHSVRLDGGILSLLRQWLPQPCLHPLGCQQVCSGLLCAHAECLSVSGQQAGQCTAVQSVSPAADVAEAVRLAVIHVQSVQRGGYQAAVCHQCQVCDVSLAQHTRPMGGVPISFQVAPAVVVAKQSPVRPYPQCVTLLFHAAYAPVGAERRQCGRQRSGGHPSVGQSLQAAHLVVYACAYGAVR